MPAVAISALALILVTLSGCGAPAAQLSADPNPIPTPPDGSFATTKISWSAGAESWGQVFISHNSGPERLFAQGAQGTAEAPWIGEGRYEFRLYAGQEHQRLLASVTVQRRAPP